MSERTDESICRSFFIFAERFDNLDQLGNYSYLLDYVLEWVEHGDAILQSGGDYADFLSGVVLACATYLDNPSVLDYDDGTGRRVERRVEGLLVRDSPNALCLDRRWWNREVFKDLSCACSSKS